jgi:SRC kinase signaling inhibitor 1
MRAYAPQMQNNLFDDDPGIMSEVETASTGFRRGGKQRSSLPVVRTPSKTLERPLGERFVVDYHKTPHPNLYRNFNYLHTIALYRFGISAISI